MANVSFTRDEIILTLDVYYTADDDKLSKGSPMIKELCTILQELPIHPKNKRTQNFRNASGVSDQIRAFRQETNGIESSGWSIGKQFHEIAMEFQGRLDELHEIATAIRRNKDYFHYCTFGQGEENSGFAEGALLGHLHRLIERRDSVKLPKEDQCAICRIDMKRIYNRFEEPLAHHLLVPVIMLDAKKRYGPQHFISVCPNCHAVLHHFRPWRTRENLDEILL